MGRRHTVDVFNLVAGIIAILTAGFSVWVYLDSRSKEKVERQKASDYQQRIADLLGMTNSAAKQGALIASIADREEVGKKELKHLTISLLATIDSIQSTLMRTRAVERAWQFGIPATYFSAVEIAQLGQHESTESREEQS
jgi:ABC-type uncharacterized transport system substrate-binding protein